MDDRQPSSHEMRTRLGWGAGIAVGMGVGVALGVALDNMGAGIAIGLAIGIALMGAFTGAGSRARRDERSVPPQDDDAGDPPAGDGR
ncbi:hypothetical protein ACFWHT_12500 [Microbacterium sp. NPDC058342]|uniref:hypothetical protein n=1 Tax=Microbacterium sp. NPDC058342 TaxID=3346454 RepID=UPI00366A3EEC